MIHCVLRNGKTVIIPQSEMDWVLYRAANGSTIRFAITERALKKSDPNRLGGLISELDETPPTTSTAGVQPRSISRPRGLIRSDRTMGQQVWAAAKWALAEQTMAFTVGLVDLYLANHLPVDAVPSTNAIGVATYIIWLMGLLQGSLGVGALALVSRATGERHQRAANAALGQAVLLAIAMGVAILVSFTATATLWGRLAGLRGLELELCTAFLRIHALAAAPMSVLFVGSASLRGAGDFRSPMQVMFVVNVINIVVSSTLVFGPAPLGGHGLIGIGSGTAAAWFIGGIMMWIRLIGARGGIQLRLHRLKPNWPVAKRILRVSLPNLAEMALFWLGNFSVIYVVAHLPGDPNAKGAHNICIRLEALSFLPGFAFGQAASALVGQYLGARNPAAARQAVWTCWRLAAGFMGFLGLAFILVPHWFVWGLTGQPAFLESASSALFIAGFGQIGFATAMVMIGALRGAGDTRVTMAISLVSMYGLRVPLVLGITCWLMPSLEGVWIALELELTIRGLLFLARFLHGGWAKITV